LESASPGEKKAVAKAGLAGRSASGVKPAAAKAAKGPPGKPGPAGPAGLLALLVLLVLLALQVLPARVPSTARLASRSRNFASLQPQVLVLIMH